MLYQKASAPRRALRRLLEILFCRLGIGRWFGRVGPFARWYRGRVFARTDHTGLHWGIYPTFEQALADIPASRKAGWDHDETAGLWVGQIDPVRPSSYPVFFWIEKLWRTNPRLVDVGGSIGLTYYGYRRYSALPADGRWTVVEVPKIAAQGARIAEREGAANLAFVDRLEHAPACDLLLSAGALQFMPQGIPGLLEALPSRPRWVVLNKLPVTERPDSWTLQNYGPAITPNRLFNERTLLDYFTGHGYVLRDRWAVQDLDMLIPFHPEQFLREFAGFVFERTS